MKNDYLKKTVCLLLALLMSLSVLTAGGFASGEPSSEVSAEASPEASCEAGGFAEDFRNAVELESGLWSRWWFNYGDQSYDAIYTDMKNLRDEGIVRIEVAKGFVWTDSAEKMNAFYYVLKAADELGMRLDFATGNPYPAVTGTTKLEVNGKVYYDPASIGYDPETCDVKSMSYAVKDVGYGLTGENILQNVGVWRSAGFSGSTFSDEQNIGLNTENGERIFAVTAAYIGEDGKSILAAADLTDSDLVEYTDAGGRHIAAYVTASPAELVELCGGERFSGGSWKLFVFFTQKQMNTVCYLGYYSTRAWTRWFKEGVIDNDAYWTEVLGLPAGEVRRLFDRVGAGLWEDSLESINISYTDYAGVDESGGEYDIFGLFERINGYAFPRERLVTLFVGGGSIYAMSGGFGKDADYVYDSVQDKQLRDDYYAALTYAYSNNHLQVYTDWAAAQGSGMDTRVQAAYMYALDQDDAYNHVTIPEQETLNATDRIDVFRGVSGAAYSAGDNRISSETGARSVFFQQETYTMAWYDWLWHANNQYMGGVTSTVLHGTEYLYQPASVWPGACMAMTKGGLAEPTGQRMPYRELMKDTVSAYLAREQFVLQQGRPDIDVAVYYYYMEIGNDHLDYFTDDCMQTAGYTYTFLGDASLQKAAAISDGSVLDEEGPSYKALVIDQYRIEEVGTNGMGASTEPFVGNGYMPLATAEAVRKMAEQGMPIVIVGKAPDKSARNADNYQNGEYAGSVGDDAVAAIFDLLAGLPNVACAGTEADVAEALVSLGVLPDAAVDEQSAASAEPDWGSIDLYSTHRSDEGVDYYMLFNRSHTVWWEDTEYGEDTLGVNKDHNVSAWVEFVGPENCSPYLLDAWSGEITPIADYTVTAEGRYRIHVELPASDTMLIAIGTKQWHDGEAAAPTAAKMEGESIDLTDGSYSWDLSLKLYKPADEWLEDPISDYSYKDYEATGESSQSTITYEYVDGIDPLGADGLTPWAELPALGANPERASGVGVYTVRFSLPADYDPGKQGYALCFGEVTELFVLELNGQKLVFDQTASHGTSGDVSEYLRPGDNMLVVTVASGLYNAAKYYNGLASAKNPSIIAQQSGESWISRDGIIGSVVLRGYTLA